MSRYSMFQALFMSFYSKKLYRDVATFWGGKTLAYLLFLLALSWIYFTYQIQHGINHFVGKNVEQLITQMPVLTITQGKISTPENRPYEIINPENKQRIAVIDTSGQYKTTEDAKSIVLVTQNEVMVQSKPEEKKTYQLPTNLNTTVEPSGVSKFVQTFLSFSWIGIFIMLVIGSFIYRLIQCLLYSIIGKIFAVISDTPVTYGQCMQIEMVAITPTIVVATILDALGVTFKFMPLCFFLLAILYLFFGIIANKSNNVIAVRSEIK